MAKEDLTTGDTAGPHGSAPAGPLSGVTIIDMTRVLAGPYCTMILSDLGARVIKVEPPGGDDSRAYGPFVNGQSAYFMSLNRGKESIALDLKSDGDRAIFEALLGRADVLVENFRPGTMDKLGYGWPTLKDCYPNLIYAACSGFGQTGPLSRRPAYDMVVQGMGGIMSLTGHDGGPPTRVGTAIGDITAGMFTAIAINSALFDRAKTGQGRQLDVAMFDCQLAILENAIARYYATGQSPGPSGARHPAIAPFECYASADGHVIIAAGNETLYRRLCEALDADHLLADPRFQSNEDRIENVVDLKIELEKILTTKPTADWLEVLETAGIPCGPLNTVQMAVEHPQAKARNMVVAIDDPAAEGIAIAGNPVKVEGYADPQKRGAIPALNGHRARILSELGLPET